MQTIEAEPPPSSRMPFKMGKTKVVIVVESPLIIENDNNLPVIVTPGKFPALRT
jgi:hypothetical protein